MNSRRPTAQNPALEQILIVGGGAGGLELATRLGNSLGKRAAAGRSLARHQNTRPRARISDHPLHPGPHTHRARAA
ncbi:MAG: hypothetical protein E6K29_01500 [Gammaproteobacteria bacterium]|nr:MAG: hypothetical protein E6K29_01500 [Gammaproteobacteria bacterium]